MDIKSLVKIDANKRNLLLIILLLILIVLSGQVFAKYVLHSENENLYVAKSFYLESDLLSSDSSTPPTYQLKAGEKDINFTLMNYPDKLRTSQVDIECEILLKAEDNSFTRKTITLSANEKDKETVNFNDLSPGSYEVTATSSSPYAATLSAVFVVTDEENITYSVNDQQGSPNLFLTITSTGYDGDVTITWPAGVYPDTTDPILESASGKSTTIKMETHSEVNLQFYKNDPSENYTNSIKVTTN